MRPRAGTNAEIPRCAQRLQGCAPAVQRNQDHPTRLPTDTAGQSPFRSGPVPPRSRRDGPALARTSAHDQALARMTFVRPATGHCSSTSGPVENREAPEETATRRGKDASFPHIDTAPCRFRPARPKVRPRPQSFQNSADGLRLPPVWQELHRNDRALEILQHARHWPSRHRARAALHDQVRPGPPQNDGRPRASAPAQDLRPGRRLPRAPAGLRSLAPARTRRRAP